MRKIQAIGNVTKDAEVRTISSGKSVIGFDIACNEKWTGRDGVKQEKVYYIKCSLWRDNTTIAQYITKGSKVYVEGTPEVEAYINKENKAVGNVKINVREIELLGGGKRADGQSQTQGMASQSQSNVDDSYNGDTLVPTPDSDLPF